MILSFFQCMPLSLNIMDAILSTPMIPDDAGFMNSLYDKSPSRLECVVWAAKVST